MPTIIRRESRACPICQLVLTILHTSEGVTVEYDVAEWERVCHHPDSDSPLTCPGSQDLVKNWLDRP